MPKYRKKPVIIEAFQHDGTLESANDIGRWCGAIHWWSESDNAFVLNIETLEGVMKASSGDYIIKGIKGEFYPCKSDIFESSYELVEA